MLPMLDDQFERKKLQAKGNFITLQLNRKNNFSSVVSELEELKERSSSGSSDASLTSNQHSAAERCSSKGARTTNNAKLSSRKKARENDGKQKGRRVGRAMSA